MKFNERLDLIFGEGSSTTLRTRLKDVDDDILNKIAEQREAHFAERQKQAFVRQHAPDMAEIMQKHIAAQKAQVLESKEPMISNFSAYGLVKNASEEKPSDRGLKHAANALHNRWNADPVGSLTIGEVATLREHVLDVFPKSAAKHVFDNQIPAMGYNALGNLPFLNKVAAEIRDQESYDAVIEDYGLGTDKYAHIQARAYIRSLVENGLSDNRFNGEKPTLRDTQSAVLERLAQLYDLEEDEDGDMGDDEDDYEDLEDTEGGDDYEPIDDDSDEEDDYEDEDEDEDGERAEVEDDDGSEHEIVMAPGEEGLPHDERTEEMTEVESPISGETLVLELGLAEDSDADITPEEDEDEEEEEDFVDGMPEHEERDTQSNYIPLPGTLNTQESMSAPRMKDAQVAKSDDTIITDPSSGKELKVILEPVEGTENAENEDEGMQKEVPMTPVEAQKICASFGLNAHDIEQALLNGDEIASGHYAIRINAQDALELRSFADVADTSNAKIVRTAAIAKMDNLVKSFIMLAAKEAQKLLKTAAPHRAPAKLKEVTASYVLTSDVPKGTSGSARRIMSSIWKVIPSAEGVLQDDGRLHVSIPKAFQRDINRIARILTDKYGVANIDTQLLEKTAQEQPQQQTSGYDGQYPLEPGQAAPNQYSHPATLPQQMPANDSPYNGQTPIANQPAGTQAPVSAPQQTPVTGSNAQADFIKRHTDPLKKAKASKLQAMKSRRAQEDEAEDAPEMDDNADAGAEGMEDAMPPEEGAMGGMQGAPQDPSQTMGGVGGGLHSEDAKAVSGALIFFRNEGAGPMAAIKDLYSKYQTLFDKYGEEGTPARNAAEAEALRLMSEAFKDPVVVPAAANKQAEIPTPKPKKPKFITVNKSMGDTNSINLKVPKQKKNVDKTMYSDPDMTVSDDPKMGGMPKHKQAPEGKKMSPKGMFSNEGEKSFEAMADRLSKKSKGGK